MTQTAAFEQRSIKSERNKKRVNHLHVKAGSERGADVAISHDETAGSMTSVQTLHNDIVQGSFDIRHDSCINFIGKGSESNGRLRKYRITNCGS